jgi:hypothetical protein
MTTLAFEIKMLNIQLVEVTQESLTVDLSDGRSLRTPLIWYPRLFHATQQEKENWKLIGKGQGIHWEDIDEDISLENLLLGRPSGESQKSLQKWLSNRATHL